jgi:hypothetical protein
MHRQWNQIEMEWGGDRNFSPQDLGGEVGGEVGGSKATGSK